MKRFFFFASGEGGTYGVITMLLQCCPVGQISSVYRQIATIGHISLIAFKMITRQLIHHLESAYSRLKRCNF